MNARFRCRLAIGFALAVVAPLGVVSAQDQRWDNKCAMRVQKDQDDVRRAIDRYGYDSPQAQHERRELQRDAQNCGYYSDSYYDGDRRGNRDDRWRNDDRDYDRQGYVNPAYDNGYRDGIAVGQRDSQKGKAYRPDKNDPYEDADNGYSRGYGDKNEYKRLYREGFRQGYSNGYGQWR